MGSPWASCQAMPQTGSSYAFPWACSLSYGCSRQTFQQSYLPCVLQMLFKDRCPQYVLQNLVCLVREHWNLENINKFQKGWDWLSLEIYVFTIYSLHVCCAFAWWCWAYNWICGDVMIGVMLDSCLDLRWTYVWILRLCWCCLFLVGRILDLVGWWGQFRSEASERILNKKASQVLLWILFKLTLCAGPQKQPNGIISTTLGPV